MLLRRQTNYIYRCCHVGGRSRVSARSALEHRGAEFLGILSAAEHALEHRGKAKATAGSMLAKARMPGVLDASDHMRKQTLVVVRRAVPRQETQALDCRVLVKQHGGRMWFVRVAVLALPGRVPHVFLHTDKVGEREAVG